MLNYIIKGGWVMAPILFCSVLGLAIVLERFYSLRESRIHPPEFVAKVKRLLHEGKISEAIAICGNSSFSISKIIEAGILKIHASRDEIKETIEHAGKRESIKLQKHLAPLATVATVAPLLGLLGTVTGMIKAFEVVATVGVGQPKDLAGGVGEALITTAAGLIIGIPALVAHNYFYKEAHGYISEMENTSMELLDILKRDEGQRSFSQRDASR
ncbi:MAG: MotA/TolQ/ExbB proton channel family protein [bacterium]